MRRMYVIFVVVLLAGVSVTLAQDAVEQSLNRVQTVLQMVIVIFPLLALVGGYFVYRRFQAVSQRIDQLEAQLRKPVQQPTNDDLQKISNEVQKVKKQLEETNKRVRETTTIKQGDTSDIQKQVTQSLLKLERSVAQQRDESVNAIRALAMLPAGERQYRVKDIEGALDNVRWRWTTTTRPFITGLATCIHRAESCKRDRHT